MTSAFATTAAEWAAARSATTRGPCLRPRSPPVGVAGDTGIEPGAHWQYNNFNPLLLGLILERATGQTVSGYLSEKLWRPLGMEAAASWSLVAMAASRRWRSGLNGRAVDFLNFGLLFLDGGAAAPAGRSRRAAGSNPRRAMTPGRGPFDEPTWAGMDADARLWLPVVDRPQSPRAVLWHGQFGSGSLRGA